MRNESLEIFCPAQRLEVVLNETVLKCTFGEHDGGSCPYARRDSYNCSDRREAGRWAKFSETTRYDKS